VTNRPRVDEGVGQALEQTPPARVRVATIALWAAWAVSAVALFVNQVLFHGSGIGPGPSVGIVSLAIQAVAFWFVRRGSSIARSFVIAVLVVAALALGILPRLIGERAVYSAGYLVLGFVLKAAATWLLFTGDSAEWFARTPPV
jgi:hypothetical protein